MSAQLISHSRDLKALLDDGYEVEIKAGHLVIHNVPYVNADKLVMRGALVVVLDVAGEATITPKTHVALFAGEHPCEKDGRKLVKIEHQSARKEICDGLAVDHSFSCKPAGGKGYKDYYEKMTTYIAIISSPAEMIDPGATARTLVCHIRSDEICEADRKQCPDRREGVRSRNRTNTTRDGGG